MFVDVDVEDAATADLLVIGGGPSGLYQAYKHLKKRPDDHVVVLEKEKQLGGRTKQIRFAGLLVPGGAGVGRLPKDKKLHRLLAELGLKSNVFESTVDYYKVKPINVMEYLEKMKKTYKKSDRETRFEEFGAAVLGRAEFKRFCDTVGYTDYLQTNTYDALYNYGFEDTISGERKFTVPWNDMIAALESRILSFKNAAIVKNSKPSDLDAIKYKKLIIAIPPHAILQQPNIMRLLAPVEREYIYGIKSQSFCYVYAKIESEEFKKTFTKYTVVPPPLQKVVPFADNVYMIAYCDNKNADAVSSAVGSASVKQNIEDLIYSVLDIRVKVKKHKVIYWKHGTHYRNTSCEYKKFSKMYGEAFAVNQGWTNGGL